MLPIGQVFEVMPRRGWCRLPGSIPGDARKGRRYRSRRKGFVVSRWDMLAAADEAERHEVAALEIARLRAKGAK